MSEKTREVPTQTMLIPWLSKVVMNTRSMGHMVPTFHGKDSSINNIPSMVVDKKDLTKRISLHCLNYQFHTIGLQHLVSIVSKQLQFTSLMSIWQSVPVVKRSIGYCLPSPVNICPLLPTLGGLTI